MRFFFTRTIPAAAVILWSLGFVFTLTDFVAAQPSPDNQDAQQIHKSMDAISANSAAIAKLEAERKYATETLDRIERWVILFFGAFGGKVIMDRTISVRLRSKVDQLEENQQHIRRSLHKLNNIAQICKASPACPACPLKVLGEEESPDAVN